MTIAINLPDEWAERVEAAAARRRVTPEDFAAAALVTCLSTETVRRNYRSLPKEEWTEGEWDAFHSEQYRRWWDGLTEEQRAAEQEKARLALDGPAHPFDPNAIRQKWGLPLDRTEEQAATSYEEALAALTPEQRANAERLGLL